MNTVALIAVLVAGARLMYHALGERRVARRGEVRGAPRVAIARAGEGQRTCVVGALSGELPLVAPFTGRRCVYWRYEIEQRDAQAPHGWTRLGGDASALSTFVLADDSGHAVVDLVDAEIVIVRDAGLRVLAIDERTPTALAWLEDRGHRTDAFFRSTHAYRVCEAALSDEDPIAVVGVGVREPDLHRVTGERGYRDAPPTLLRLGGTARHPLLVTDDPAATA